MWAAARPALVWLHEKTGESVQLYVIEPGNGGQERRCILSLQSPHGLRWIVPEGALLPPNANSKSSCMTAASSP